MIYLFMNELKSQLSVGVDLLDERGAVYGNSSDIV